MQANPDNFDLVITDQTMPEMSGEEMARQILQIKPEIPIILCTGFSATVSEETAMALGIKAFLIKPVEFKKLAVAIRTFLDERLDSFRPQPTSDSASPDV